MDPAPSPPPIPWAPSDPAPRFARSLEGDLRVGRHPRDVLGGTNGLARLDRRSAWQVLAFHEYAARRSFFEGIAQVPPRESVVGGPDGSLAFQVAAGPPRREIGRDEAALAVHQAVLEVVGAAVAPARRVALLLSGGLDSSLLAAALVTTWSRLGRDPRDLHLLHQAWPGGRGEEGAAGAVARRLGLDLTVRPLPEGDPYEGTEACLRHLPTPVDDGGLQPLLGMLQHARDLGADTVLTGDGGDEVFEGWYLAPWRRHPTWTRPGRYLGAGARRLGRALQRRGGGRAAEWRRRLRAAEVPPWLEARAPDRDPAPESDYPPARIGLRGDRARRDRATRSARASLVVTTLQAVGETVGLRVTLPLLDARLLDLVVALPPSLFVPRPGGPDKALARAAFARDLPPEALARGKDQPTAVPWMREGWSRYGEGWYERHVAGGALERLGLVDPSAAHALVARPEESPGALWRAQALVSIGAWCRAWGL